jgi:hypothetical protein
MCHPQHWPLIWDKVLSRPRNSLKRELPSAEIALASSGEFINEYASFRSWIQRTLHRHDIDALTPIKTQCNQDGKLMLDAFYQDRAICMKHWQDLNDEMNRLDQRTTEFPILQQSTGFKHGQEPNWQEIVNDYQDIYDGVLQKKRLAAKEPQQQQQQQQREKPSTKSSWFSWLTK